MPAVLKRDRAEFWAAYYEAAKQIEAEDAKPNKVIPRVAKLLDVDASTAWRYRERWGLPDEVRDEVAKLADNPDGDAPDAAIGEAIIPTSPVPQYNIMGIGRLS